MPLPYAGKTDFPAIITAIRSGRIIRSLAHNLLIVSIYIICFSSPLIYSGFIYNALVHEIIIAGQRVLITDFQQYKYVSMIDIR